MFFDKVLVENSELRRVWRAGFGRMEEPEENTSFPNICTDLEKRVGSDDLNPRKRLSLRTSSVLVEGAARIYRQELSRLMEALSEVDRVLANRSEWKTTDSEGDTSNDLSEVDRELANRNKKKLTESEGDTSTDSSNPSTPYDTPEHMRRQTPRCSDVSIQRPDNETIASLNASDLSHSLSSIRKSRNSQQSSRNDFQNGQSAKRRKMTDQTSKSPDYPSSPHLDTDRNSEDLISDDDNQISEQPTKDANAALHSDDQATRKSDQNETEESSKEENAPKSPTFTEKFDFVAALPNYDPDISIPEIDVEGTKSMTDENCEEIINEAQNDVVKDSDIGRVDLSPILPSRARKVLRNSRWGTKNIDRSVVKKDQATQLDDVSFHPDMSERDRSANVNLPFGYLLIHDTYSSRYPSKIVLSSLTTTFVRNL